MTLRLALAVLGIAVLSGAATAALAYNEVGKLIDALKLSKAVKVAPKVLAPTYNGGPETLLLVGNDVRRHTTTSPVVPHSNEMLLVRIDPRRPVISMLSIPRELQVTFTAPNGEVITNRFNSAYTYGYEEGGGTKGGIKLMVETIKKALGLEVNHVFIIDFKKFEHAIEEMGCVYFPVDKRYFHKNEPGGEQYFEINLQPGYQTLCGEEALEYVANRHESTSLMRDARDQRFLLEAKKEYGGELFEEREKFEHIFGKNVETDLRGEEQVLNLIELLVQAQGKPVRQVHFHAELVPANQTSCACVLASQEQIDQARNEFLGGTAPISQRRQNEAVNSVRQARSHRRRKHGKAPAPLSMTPTSSEALAHARSLAPRLPFALEYPRIRSSYGGAEEDTLRFYRLHGPHHRPHSSYVIVVDRGLLGQYYDIEGTTWLHPPILADPSQNAQIGNRTYSLYYSGEHITTVAWREGNAVYWIENTLENNLSPREMLEIAQETQPVSRAVARAPLRRAKAAEAALRVSPNTTPVSTADKVGIGVAILVLLGLATLSAQTLRRRRETRELEERMVQATARWRG